MRIIGHLGSQLDPSDPAGSAQKLATMFMGGLVAPAAAAINQILQLVNDPNLIPNLIQRGITFAKALAQQLFWLAGPQVAATATDLVNAVTNVINLVTSRDMGGHPRRHHHHRHHGLRGRTALSQMKDKTTTINVSGFGPVGSGLARPGANIGDLATAVLNAISVATGGVGTQSTGCSAPRSHSSPRPPSPRHSSTTPTSSKAASTRTTPPPRWTSPATPAPRSSSATSSTRSTNSSEGGTP